MNLAQNVCLDDFRSGLKLTWNKKLGHQAKSKENLINTRNGCLDAQNVCLDDF